jgi:heavy metal translocating P-type ATPase
MNDSAPGACVLCGLPVRGRSDGFCCVGCRHAHELLGELLGTTDPDAMRGHELFATLRAAGLVPSVPGDAATIDGPPPTDDEPPPPPGEVVERTVFAVSGMWCPSCAWVIERVLARTSGVLHARASFAADRVRVTYLPRAVGPDTLRRVIEDLGYRTGVPDAEARQGRELTGEIFRLGIALFLCCNVMMLSFALYQGFFTNVPANTSRLIGLPILLLSSVVVFWCGGPILSRAYRAARAGALVMETQIALGALSAFSLSVTALVRDSPHQYFDTASMLIGLVLLGKFLENRVRARAGRGIEEIHELIPGKARLETEDGNRYVAAEAVLPGDLVRVREGEAIPADGTIASGAGVADESKNTGETTPRRKGEGDTVLAGSVLSSGEIVLRATASGESTAIGRMVRLMDEAIAAKNPMERLADRAMAWFIPAVVAIAVACAVVLLATGRTWEAALVRAITVLVIACPCALGIATPLAKVAAIGAARREGILVADGDAFEATGRLTALVLDKTGTATVGAYRILGVWASGFGEDEVLALARAAEADSAHPVARAIRTHAPAGVIVAQESEEFPGLGVRARVDGADVLVGGARLLAQCGIVPGAEAMARIDEAAARGETAVLVARDGRAIGVIRLGDEVRADLPETVAALRGRGLPVHLVSGDSAEATAAVARALGVDEYAGGVLPADKVERIRALRRAGHRVGMVGDGANDAAALAAADVGFATGDALAVTRHASDVTLLAFSGARLLQAFAIARRASRAIRVNLGLALVYNVLAIPLAVAGIVNPILAVSIMLLSSLTVVLNSARIARGPALA